jgi:hypothetical protein
MPSLADVLWLAAMLATMALVVIFAIWYTRRIRDGTADPIISPDWTSFERPTSPPSSIRWGGGEYREVEDDHVGRPFPPSDA